MNVFDNLLLKGERYSKKFLQDALFKFVSESNMFFFYRKGGLVYVFDKNNSKHPDEFLLVAIWED
ncbi:MAG: hypothetical protein WCO13_12575 [Bacteroidota bacterium]